MKVSDLMHTRLFTVTPDSPVSEVARIIFNMGISGVPVVENGKLVGLVTEEDLLKKLFPSVQEFFSDAVGARDFDAMEDRMSDLVNVNVRKIMNKSATTVFPNTPIMKATSIMMVHNFSRLPVVDADQKLIGILSQGDIFKFLLKKELPKIEQSKYATFIGENYGQMVQWEKRFSNEFPALFSLFRELNVESVVDLGSWTGEYALGLAKNGLNVIGVDNNDLMVSISNSFKKTFSKDIQERVQFVRIDYHKLKQNLEREFDSVICMGNSLPYIYEPLPSLFKGVNLLLRKRGVFIADILNFRKILNLKHGLLSFKIINSSKQNSKRLFLEYIEKDSSDWLNHSIAGFEFDGRNWIFSGLNTVKVYNIQMKELETLLRKANFKHLSISGHMGTYQDEYGPLTFSTPFDPEKSDWLTVVAVK
jgi:CBS domain-containing protein/ubiquinone/menaquinone biosynthesis C-methylase UbiE